MIAKTYKNLILYLVGFSLIMLILGIIIFNFLQINIFFLLYINVFFFSTVSLLFHLISTKSSKKSPQHFSRTYLVLITIKIFIYLIFLLILLFTNKNYKVIVLLTFLIHYISYTIFEIIFLFNFFKKNS